MISRRTLSTFSGAAELASELSDEFLKPVYLTIVLEELKIGDESVGGGKVFASKLLAGENSSPTATLGLVGGSMPRNSGSEFIMREFILNEIWAIDERGYVGVPESCHRSSEVRAEMWYRDLATNEWGSDDLGMLEGLQSSGKVGVEISGCRETEMGSEAEALGHGRNTAEQRHTRRRVVATTVKGDELCRCAGRIMIVLRKIRRPSSLPKPVPPGPSPLHE